MINVLQKNQEKSECLSDVIDLVALEYAGGDGTESSPYLIENAEQLKLLAKEVNELHLDTLNKHYKLIKDIDLSGCNWTPIGEISDGSDSYNSYCFFRGVFDGNNFTVHNLTINKSEGSCLGLFGCITDKVSVHDSCYISPVIKNLTIKNVNIIGKSMIGSIVGRVDLSTNNTSDDKFSNLLIENCHVRKAKISALNDIGGLTGRSSNSVTFLNSDTYDIHITMNKDHYVSGGTSAGTTCSGGFVGKANGSYNAPGFFTNCHSFNVVINDSILQNGGFVGNTGQIVYNQCSAKSEILLSEEVGVQCGGFAGFSTNVDPSSAGYMRVGYNECSADAVIKGRTENLNLHGSAGTNGGFIGYSSSTQCYFTNCRVTGNIFGNSRTGGFIGSVQSYGTPGDSSAASFNDVVVSCKIYGSKENYTSVSPIFGTNVSEDSTINQLCERVYYDEEVCEISIREVGTGLKTGKLTGEAAKTNTGLDFVSTWQVIDGDYPKLSTIIENSPFENINIPNGWVAVGERQLQTAQKELVDFINKGFETVDSRLNEVESKLNSDSSQLDLGIICEPETPFDPINYLPIPRTEHIGPDKEYRYWIFLTGGFMDTLYITNKKVIYDQSSQKLKMKTEESFGYYKYEDNVSYWDFCENESSTLSISADRLDVVESNYDVKNQDGVILRHANKGLGSNYDHRVLSVAKGTSAALEGYCGKPGELAFNTETKGLHLLGGFVPGGEQVALMSDLFDEVKEIKLKDKKLEPSTVVVHDGSIRFEPTGELHVVANELKEAIVYDESMPLIDYYGKFTWEISFSESFLQNQSKIYLLKSNEESPTKFEAYITVTAEGTEQFVVVVDEEETVEEMVSYGEKYLKANERIKLEIEVKEYSSHSATDSVTLCVDNYPVVSSVVNGKAEGSKHRLSLGVPDGVELTVYGVKVDAQKTCVGQTYRKSEIDHLINEVKSSVSDGKRLIASAITDKGVEASESDSFQTLAEKIAAITSSQSTVDVMKSSSDGKALELLGTTGGNFKKLSITSTMPEDSVNSSDKLEKSND